MLLVDGPDKLVRQSIEIQLIFSNNIVPQIKPAAKFSVTDIVCDIDSPAAGILPNDPIPCAHFQIIAAVALHQGTPFGRNNGQRTVALFKGFHVKVLIEFRNKGGAFVPEIVGGVIIFHTHNLIIELSNLIGNFIDRFYPGTDGIG